MLILWLLSCAPGADPGDIVVGDYDFYTVSVLDGCLDGALEALFMPEGREVAHAFSYPIYLPHPDECPLSYEVDFREPFVGMPVTVQATDTGLEVRGSVMDSVLLGATYGDCAVTMSVDVDLAPVASGELSGTAYLDLSDPRGEDGLCPVFEADPCQVRLELQALLP